MILISNLPDEDILSQYYREIEKFQPLNADKEKKLAFQIHKGNKGALKKLVTANLRFVVSVALTYAHQGMPLSDLINEGNMGLIRAAARFDEKKNFKFVSYASWWIRHSILQALSKQSRFFSVPIDQVLKIHNLGKTRQRLEQKLGHSPSTHEIAVESKLMVNEIDKILEIDQKQISLDEPQNGKFDSKPIKDFIQNQKSEPPDNRISEESSHIAIMSVVSSLSDREKQIINDYYGLSGNEPLTLAEIGNNLNITRERVRQIKKSAIKRLRNEDFRNLLREAIHNGHSTEF